jgi:hypothetical protein
MTNHSLRVKIINRNKEVTSLRDYAVTWNFSLSHVRHPARWAEPRATRAEKPPALAAEGQQLAVTARAAA